MAFQPDLFGPALLPGLAVCIEIVGMAEEAALITAIEDEALAPFRFHGWHGNRLTASFGWQYDFDTGRIGRATPIPAAFLPLRERVAAFAGVAATDLAQLLLTRYDSGAGIGWHRDRAVFETIVGVSLGAPASLRFRRRSATGFDRYSLPLAPRSAYCMSGAARHDWEHSIAEMTATRWSLTFRNLACATAERSVLLT